MNSFGAFWENFVIEMCLVATKFLSGENLVNEIPEMRGLNWELHILSIWLFWEAKAYYFLNGKYVKGRVALITSLL